MQAIIKKYGLDNKKPPKQQKEFGIVIPKAQEEKAVPLKINVVSKVGEIDRDDIMRRLKSKMISKIGLTKLPNI